MSKCKLTVENYEKFKTSCDLSNVEIVQEVSFGAIKQVVISFKQPEQLINLGKYLMQDIKAPEANKAPEAEPVKDAVKDGKGKK